MRYIKICIIIAVVIQLISCSPQKTLITFDSNKMIKVNSFDVDGKNLVLALSSADSLWINGKFNNSTKGMWNSALFELKGNKVVFSKSDFSTNPNTIRFVDYDTEKNILINGFFESEIDVGSNYKYKSECRNIDYSVKYQNDKRIIGFCIIENRNYSRTSGHEISSPSDFWFFNSVGDVYLDSNYIDNDKGLMTQSFNMVKVTDEKYDTKFTNFKPTEKYDYFPTAVNNVISTSENVFLNTRDRSSYSSKLMKFDDKLIEQGSVKIPSFSYYPDMFSFRDSVYILAHKRNNELNLITIDSNLESVKTGKILSDLCKPSSSNDNYKLIVLNGELFVVEIKKTSMDNIETNTISIISLKEEALISKTELSKINDLNIKLTDKYLFIGGNFEKILKIDDEVYKSDKNKTGIIVRKNWR